MTLRSLCLGVVTNLLEIGGLCNSSIGWALLNHQSGLGPGAFVPIDHHVEKSK